MVVCRTPMILHTLPQLCACRAIFVDSDASCINILTMYVSYNIRTETDSTMIHAYVIYVTMTHTVPTIHTTPTMPYIVSDESAVSELLFSETKKTKECGGRVQKILPFSKPLKYIKKN